MALLEPKALHLCLALPLPSWRRCAAFALCASAAFVAKTPPCLAVSLRPSRLGCLSLPFHCQVSQFTALSRTFHWPFLWAAGRGGQPPFPQPGPPRESAAGGRCCQWLCGRALSALLLTLRSSLSALCALRSLRSARSSALLCAPLSPLSPLCLSLSSDLLRSSSPLRSSTFTIRRTCRLLTNMPTSIDGASEIGPAAPPCRKVLYEEVEVDELAELGEKARNQRDDQPWSRHLHAVSLVARLIGKRGSSQGALMARSGHESRRSSRALARPLHAPTRDAVGACKAASREEQRTEQRAESSEQRAAASSSSEQR